MTTGKIKGDGNIGKKRWVSCGGISGAQIGTALFGLQWGAEGERRSDGAVEARIQWIFFLLKQLCAGRGVLGMQTRSIEELALGIDKPLRATGGQSELPERHVSLKRWPYFF